MNYHHRIAIDWSELDLFGHVNNVAFFKYLQSSRVKFWEQCGFSSTDVHAKKGFILASSECTFVRPLFYPGFVQANLYVSFIKNSSFGIVHQLYNEKHELVAEGKDVLVFYDYDKNEKIILDEELKEKLKGFLKA